MNKDKWLNLTFTTGISKNLMQNVNYNFMGMMKRSFTVFGAVSYTHLDVYKRQSLM